MLATVEAITREREREGETPMPRTLIDTKMAMLDESYSELIDEALQRDDHHRAESLAAAYARKVDRLAALRDHYATARAV